MAINCSAPLFKRMIRRLRRIIIGLNSHTIKKCYHGSNKYHRFLEVPELVDHQSWNLNSISYLVPTIACWGCHCTPVGLEVLFFIREKNGSKPKVSSESYVNEFTYLLMELVNYVSLTFSVKSQQFLAGK